MNRTIEIVINLAGQTTIQTKGFVGASCQDASRLLEQALGQRTTEQITAEYYEGAAVPHVQQELK